MPFLDRPDARLHYALHGPADAPPLLMLHGATDTFGSGWNKQVAPLGATLRLIGPDLRGHGQSTNPAGALSLQALVDDALALLDTLAIERAHVCGFSGGGTTALALAVAAPQRVRGLVLVSNDLNDGLARIARGFWDPARMQREQLGWWKHMLTVHAHSTPADLLRQWQALDAARGAWQPQQLARVTMPALVVAGDRDDVVPLSESVALYQALPHAQLAVLPGIGHGAPPRGAAMFNQLVREFVR